MLFMAETLKDIIKNSPDLHLIKVDKHNSQDRSEWEFQVMEPGIKLDDSHFQTVTLRRDNHFFLAYKFFFGDEYRYFVDPAKANHRNSIYKYIKSLIGYSVYSNDVSRTKNEPSFKITLNKMKSYGIDNFLDLCYYYKDYSAIGTGLTRNLRNLVVMDIDVDCTKASNKEELDELLLRFAKYNALPDFQIFNTESKHVQLQWLIQNYKYKEINQEAVENLTEELTLDRNRCRELKYLGMDFTRIDNPGYFYRRYTLAMCDLVNKRKFGDKNYTFWKAKNPMAALMGNYGLELKMPYFDGELKYRTQEEMESLFSTKEARQNYFSNTPDMLTLTKMTGEMLDILMDNVKESKIKKIEDDIDVSEVKDKPRRVFGTSRNNFVLNCTRITTWEKCAEYGYRVSSSIRSLDRKTLEIFKKDVLKTVRQRFRAEDKKWGGIWPDTTNLSEYSSEEFKVTFNRSFNYAIQNLNIEVYTEEQRKRSQESRHLKMDMRLMVVDHIRRENEGIPRQELFKKVNETLVEKKQKPISLGSLKRYISESKKLDTGQREVIITKLKEAVTERQRQYDEAVDEHKNQRTIDVCKRRLDYINIS